MPAQYDNSVRVVVNGTLGQNEVFSWGFWMAGNAGLADTQAKLDALATAAATAITTRSTNFAAGLASDGAYQNVRLYSYPNRLIPAAFISQAAASVTGTGSGSLPLQTAVVASLRSLGASRGSRGRLYLPATGYALTAHQLTSSQCTTISATVRAVLNDMKTAGGAGAQIIVNSATTPAMPIVDRVIVDSRLDVQRRRAESEQVLYAATTQL